MMIRLLDTTYLFFRQEGRGPFNKVEDVTTLDLMENLILCLHQLTNNSPANRSILCNPDLVDVLKRTLNVFNNVSEVPSRKQEQFLRSTRMSLGILVNLTTNNYEGAFFVDQTGPLEMFKVLIGKYNQAPQGSHEQKICKSIHWALINFNTLEGSFW